MPLTNAEKQARWRERREQRYRERAMLVVGLEERVAELEAQSNGQLRNQTEENELRNQVKELQAKLAEWEKASIAWRELEFRLAAVEAGGVFSRAEYKQIAACLHPDRVAGTELEKRYTAAFNTFSAAEKLIVKPEPRPVSAGIPRNPAEWAAAKRRGQEERKRKREAAKAAKQPKRQLRNQPSA